MDGGVVAGKKKAGYGGLLTGHRRSCSTFSSSPTQRCTNLQFRIATLCLASSRRKIRLLKRKLPRHSRWHKRNSKNAC